jgi:hypothetical protein
VENLSLENIFEVTDLAILYEVERLLKVVTDMFLR